MFNFCLPTFLPGVPVTRCDTERRMCGHDGSLSPEAPSLLTTHTPVSVWAGHTSLNTRSCSPNTRGNTQGRVCDQTSYLLYYERETKL